MFTHLHVHSHYSFLEGVASPADLVSAAVLNGMGALALTDHNALTGAIEFYDACQAKGVKPILGLELTTSTPFGVDVLTLLAMNMNGWGNLCRLSSILQTDPKHDPSRGLPLDIVAQHSSDLICLVGGALIGRESDDVAAQYLQQLKTFFADRLYVELQQPLVSQLATLAHKIFLPIVATHNIYYLTADQADLQHTLTAIRLNKPRGDLSSDEIAPPDSHFLSANEMSTHFNDHPAALAATAEIAERCQLQLPLDDHPAALAATAEIAVRCRLQLPLGVQHYPEIALHDGLTAIEVLRGKSFEGAKRFYGSVTSEIETRLNHELQVIGEKGYAPLFLIMEEILSYARKTGVPTASRGSASSSLVAHCLGVTTPDPIRLNLYFERFLNPARSTPPDIDTDLCSRRRDRVIQHVYEQYGEDRVAMVCTINRFRERSAMREVAKAYGLAPKEVTTLTDLMPHRWYGPPQKSAASPFAEIAQHYNSPTHQRIFHDAQKILGLPRHLSIHPGGVVITPKAMTDLVPTLLSTKGIVITQFDLDSIERMGLVKIDLLGIRGLTVLGDVAETISKQQPSAKRSSTLDILDSIPLDDLLTKESVRMGRTIGCLQIERPGMRATLQEINANTVDDIMVALALYRPGPLTGGLKDAFVRRHLKQES
ncbi:MAG: DNA polymerase III subunit alpha, partial [Chloroflexi bacterium]|nr:DNA polymerase III subunit alpha [Chloroflexota bacterium]